MPTIAPDPDATAIARSSAEKHAANGLGIDVVARRAVCASIQTRCQLIALPEALQKTILSRRGEYRPGGVEFQTYGRIGQESPSS